MVNLLQKRDEIVAFGEPLLQKWQACERMCGVVPAIERRIAAKEQASVHFAHRADRTVDFF